MLLRLDALHLRTAFVSDLSLLYKLLHENYNEMSRWDVYKAEVESGHLEWGIIHSEKFFKEHAKRLEGKNGDFALLRVRVPIAFMHQCRNYVS